MGTVQTHPLIADYLRRLHAAAWVLPPDRRDELVSEIREHIDAALRTGGTRDEVAIRNVLERLGAPEEIAAAAMDGPPAAAAAAVPGRSASGVGGVEITSIVLLAVGGVVVPVIGLVVGVALTWASALWTRVDKLVATALPLAFMALPWIAFAVRNVLLGGWLTGRTDPSRSVLSLGPAGPWELLWMGPLVGGVLAAVYLAVRASRRARTTG